jgi:dolichol-phosphate mannosyltransferase
LRLIDTKSDGYCFQIETWRRFRQANLHVVELPIKFNERQSGISKINFRIILEAMMRVAIWGFHDIFGKAK